jgi:alcohol dehydrogenase (cytochrome c)
MGEPNRTFYKQSEENMKRKNIIIVVVGLLVLSTALAGAVSSGTTQKAGKTSTDHMTKTNSQMMNSQIHKDSQMTQTEKMESHEKAKKVISSAEKNESKEICPENVSKNASRAIGGLTLRTGVQNVNNWAMVNYDLLMSRHSRQTTIGKGNVANLQVKWIFNTGFTVEDSPLIIDDKVYIQNNAMQVFALDLNTGLNIWKYDPHVVLPSGLLPRATSSHGMTFDNNTVYAPTGANGTVVAINAINGNKVWESPKLAQGTAWRISAPPLIYNNYVIVGSALGDEPPFGFPAQGMVSAVSKKTGDVLWQTKTAIGAWVEGANANVNGGATSWSGGAIDAEKGIVYLPTGNPAPDFNALSRPEPTLYANSFIAINITNGQILWNTPFIAQGSILPNVVTPDTHDWDTAWGSNLAIARINGAMQKIVIGHDKRGDVMAMDPFSGRPLWWINLAVLRNETIQASPTGSQTVWPGPGYGVESYTAVDDTTLYAAVSNMGTHYYSNGTVAPDFNAIWNGVGNGSINAVDLSTGKLKWKHDTPFPTFVSPLVTNGVVFSGHYTATGKDYPFNAFAGPTETNVMSSGILLALDKDTGKTLWQANLGAPVGIGGPSIGQGLLVVPTGNIQVPNAGGYVVAFGLPSRAVPDFSLRSEEIGRQLPIIPLNRNLNMGGTATARYPYPTQLGMNQTLPIPVTNMTPMTNVTTTFQNVTTTPITNVTTGQNMGTPTLSIAWPKEGATVTNGTVKVNVSYFTVIDKFGEKVVAGQGHIHYFMNVTPPTEQGKPATTANGTWIQSSNFSYDWMNMTAGKHMLAVELVNNDHTPLNPPVVAMVNVTFGAATGNMTTTKPTNMTNTTTTTTGKTATVMLSAQNIKFNMSTITVPAGATVTVKFDNMDSGVPHNFAVYQSSAATQSIFKGQMITGPATTTYTFTAPTTPGKYFFRCDVHPTIMFGDFVVQ